MWMVDVSIRRPVFAIMIIGGLMALGFISLGRLGVDLFPNVAFPYVAITTTLEGAGPKAIETEVTDIIEENVNTISGINKLRSTSSEGMSQVFIEFALDEDVNVKAQDVRDKVSLARRNLPLDANPPIVEKVDPDAAPIMSVMIAGDVPIGELTNFADEVVKEALQRLSGVGSVTLIGGRKREIRIWLDAKKMRSYEVTAEDVVNAIRAEHTEIPSGKLETRFGAREYSVKTVSEAKTPEEFADLVVAFRANGLATRVGDVATIEDGLEDERTYAILNGQRGVSLEIRRQSGKNTVEVAHAVKRELEALRSDTPSGIKMVVARDVSRFIESSIADVSHELQIAIGLVILVTFFFLLNWRATLIVAIAIPTSLISTFFGFYLMGFTINMLTLLALTVSIGLLVDDAIVVVESIQKDIEAGSSPLKAAQEGTKKVGLAVLAGTFATLAVFVPIAFMEGVVGRFFFEYGLAIIFSVSISLLVALTLTPMLSSRYLHQEGHQSGIFGLIEKFHLGLANWYGKSLAVCVSWRYLILALAIASVFLGGWFAQQIPAGFTSNSDRSEFMGTIELPLGYGIEEAKKASNKVNEALKATPYVTDVFVTAGAGSQAKVNQLGLYARLEAKQARDENQFIIMDIARKAVADKLPEISKMTIIEVPWISGGGIGSADIELSVRGKDLEGLQEYTDGIVAEMKKSDQFADVRTSFEAGRPEYRIEFDRIRAGDMGVSARSLANTARVVIGGVDVGNFEDQGKRYDVRVRLKEQQRQDADQLDLVQIRSKNGMLIDLGSVSDTKLTTSLSQIDRQNRARKISILANSAPSVALGESTAELESIVETHVLPQGFSLSFDGMARRMKESGASIIFALLLALLALYMVLASQFNSFVQPLITMITAPLSFSGAFAMLYWGDQEMSLFAQIGLIGLMGIVMKNGILLLDRTNQLTDEGIELRTAVLQSGPERLRPVLMTALAAIFGMIPIAMSVSDGAEWRNAMGYLIIGGLTSSTLLTLFVVPAATMVPQDISKLFWRFTNVKR
jgi:HAE1 family hydrophobic/amphiphilic exporter-1